MINVSEEEFVDSIVNIVTDCCFDGCNTASAEYQAGKLYKHIKECGTPVNEGIGNEF